jgi:Flp pilus assembly protein CpaB
MAAETWVAHDDQVGRPEPAGTRRRRRRFGDRPAVPNPRALVGGLLLAVAAVGTFLTWHAAAGTPDTTYVVARRAVRVGERLARDDLALAGAELPGGLAGGAFDDPEVVVGRVVLGPIGEGELVQASQLSTPGAAPATVEVAFSVPRDRALDGALVGGDRVDVFVTYDDRTQLVVARAQVLAVGGAEATGLADVGEVTVTLGLADDQPRAELIHASRAGDVTLVRSTQADVAVDPADEVYAPPVAGSAGASGAAGSAGFAGFGGAAGASGGRSS